MLSRSNETNGHRAIRHLTDADFLDETTGAWTVVDFWASWCAPCRAFGRVFERVAEAHGDRLRFAKLNVDESPASAALCQVRTIPTCILFDPEGNEVGRVVNPGGAFEAMILDVIDEKSL